MSLRSEAVAFAAEERKQQRNAARERRALQISKWEEQASAVFGIPVVHDRVQEVSTLVYRNAGYATRKVVETSSVEVFKMDDIELCLPSSSSYEWHLLIEDPEHGPYIGDYISRPFRVESDEDRRAQTVANLARALNHSSKHPVTEASGSLCPTCHEVRS